MLAGEGLKVVDLTLGLSGALVVSQLAYAGASITRAVPSAGDPFDAELPCYAYLKASSRLLVEGELEGALDRADICLVGGEDDPEREWSFKVDDLTRLRPRLIVLHIGGYVDSDRPANELLVQARTGLVHEQLSDRPIAFAVRLATYGAAMTGLLGIWSALYERNRSGRGQIVYATLQQGVSLFWSQIWMSAEKADPLFDKLPPKDVQHLIFQCADQKWLHFVLGVPGAMAKLYNVLGIEASVDPNDRGIPTLSRGPQSYFADRALIAPAIAGWDRDALVRALNAAGLAAEPVLAPGAAWAERQTVATRLIRQTVAGVRIVDTPLRLAAVSESASSTAPDEGPARSGPLSGVRVVDLGNFIAGPFASKLLADLGADVIRIEPPGSLAALTGIRNTWASNRGKRSIVLDMKQPEDMAIVRRLCAGADVVTHNFRAGVASRLGVDPASLRHLNPSVITLETSGYGAEGLRAAEPGWDMVMQALCGHEMRAGGEGNAPLWYRSALVDFATGALGAIGCAMALYARSCGRGSIEVRNSLLATALFLMSELIETADGDFAGAPLLDADRTGFHAAERLYRTADGWIAVAARSDRMAAAMAAALQLSDMPPGADWDNVAAVRIAAAFAGMATDAALTLLSEAGVWAERCTDDGWAKLRDDPVAGRNGLVIEATDANYGKIAAASGPFIRFSRTRIDGPFRPAPVSGGDAGEILAELSRRSPAHPLDDPTPMSGRTE